MANELVNLQTNENVVTENIKLYFGDCLEKLSLVEDNSVDLILCDLPYGSTKCKWDTIVDIDKLWIHYKRVIKKPHGVILLFGQQPFTSKLVSSNYNWFKYNLIWKKNKTTQFLLANYRPMKCTEDICVFSPGGAAPASRAKGNMTYNPQGLIEVEIKKKNSEKRIGKMLNQAHHLGPNNKLISNTEYTQKFTNYPNELIDFPIESNTSHETQKPVKLIEHLIKTYSNENGLVLDNTMGSGTTGVGCVNTNRKFIGIEIEEKYFKLSKHRIKTNFQTSMDTLNSILETKTVIEVAKELSISKSTINRWIELNNIPSSYTFDLLKLNNEKIDYTIYSSSSKDQFFTKEETAKKCYKMFDEVMEQYNETVSEYTFIEPSAGDGTFLKVLPKDDTISLDIEPRHEKIKQQDFLEWKPLEDKKYIVFGNPPFGLRGNLALRFINHSNKFSDFVCFILPQLFESDGKGVPRKRVKGYNLLLSKKLEDTMFYNPDNEDMKINVVFQIWSKYHMNDKYRIKDTTNEDIKVYSLSDGGTAASTRNKNMLHKCDTYLPSTCFGEENMKAYSKFDDLPGKKGYGVVFSKDKKEMVEKSKKIKWKQVSFLSTNSALNLRTSTIIEQFTKKE